MAKAVIMTLAYATFVALANVVLGTNYLYLCRKPDRASLMDYLGPWPWYIGALVLVVIVTCLVCYLPFAFFEWRSKRRTRAV